MNQRVARSGLAAIVTFATAWCAAQDAPSNAALISAMPDEIESVMVLDATKLLASDSHLKKEFAPWFGTLDPNTVGVGSDARDFVSSTGENNLDRVVYQRILKLRPAKRVLAGADFKPPSEIGIGRCRYLAVWITSESNESLRDDIAQARGVLGEVRHVRVGDAEAYRSTIEIQHAQRIGGPEKPAPETLEVTVSFPTPHITIVSFLPDAPAQVAKSLRKTTDAKVPAKWAEFGRGVDLQAPVVLLRRLASPEQCVGFPNPENPSRPIIKNINVIGFGVSLTATDPLRFKVSASAANPEDGYLYLQGGGFRGGFPAPVFKWDRTDRSGGLDADVTFAPPDLKQNHHADLCLLALFGLELWI